MPTHESNYLEDIALEIMEAALGEGDITSDYLPLYCIYAVLALAKGTNVTPEDVHNAWSAWATTYHGSHKSLLPYNELAEETKRLDDPFVDAIHVVVRRHVVS